MQVRRKYKQRKTECISEFNKRKEYSRMLREQEEQERIKEELEEMQKKKGTKKYDRELVRKYQPNHQVKFDNEDENQEKNNFTQADFDAYQNVTSSFKAKEKKGSKNPNHLAEREKLLALRNRNNKLKGSKISRDIGRSAWWKDTRDLSSTNKKIQHWIKINDIRYGIDK